MPPRKLATDVIASLREENKQLVQDNVELRRLLDEAEARLFRDGLLHQACDALHRALRVAARKLPKTVAGRATKAEARSILIDGNLKPPPELRRTRKGG